MLVVVEDGDVHLLAQATLDLEALGRLDVFQVDAAEGRLETPHAFDELVDRLGVNLDVEAVDVGELLEEDRLALHDGLRREGTDVTEAEDGRAVRDDRDEVALRGELVDGVGVLRDDPARFGDAGRVGET